MIPARFATPLFSLILSGTMSLIVSGITTVRPVGWSDGVIAFWLSNWASSWIVAFPAVLIVAPLARRVVARLCAPPAAAPPQGR